jgi:hypothetical protein
MSKAAKKLSKLAKIWSKTEARTGGIVPVGTYAVEIKAVKIEDGKNGSPKLHWTFEVADGDYEGKKIPKWDNLETDNNLAFVKGAMQALGLEIPDDIEDLEEALQEAVGLSCEVRVVEKDEYINVYIQRLLDGDDDEEEEDEDEAESDEAEEDDEDDEEEADEDEEDDEDEDEDEDEEEEEEEEAPKKAAKGKGKGKKSKK